MTLNASLWPGAAAAQDASDEDSFELDERDETERWVPSIGLFGGFIAMRARGRALSYEVLGPAVGGTQLVRPVASTSDTLLAASTGLSFEIMTPRLVDALGKPRLFAHADLFGAIGFKRTLASEGSPGRVEVPGPIQGRPTIPEASLTGQGSRTYAEYLPFMFSAGLGPAFTFDLDERRIRIKPSIEYRWQEIEVSGVVKRVVATNSPSRVFPDDFRIIKLANDDRVAVHGLGLGLEVEADTVRAGDFMTSVFASAQGYRLFGDDEFSIKNVNQFGETAVFTFERDDWSWGARIGVRFRWMPLGD